MSPTDNKSDRLPKTLGLLILGAYFLLFTFATAPPQTDADQINVNPHQVPWLRLIIPDTVVSEWAEHSFQRVGLTDRLPLLSGTAGLLLAVMLVGQSVLRVLKVSGLTKLEQVVLRFGLGTITLTLFAFGVGVLGGLQLWWIYLLPLALAVFFEWKAGSDLFSRRGLGSCWSCILQPRKERWWLIVIPFGIIVAGAMLPPWEFDVREYHLQVPKEWFQSGGLTHLPHNSYSSMPLGAELISVIPMAWAQLFSESDAWWYGALIGKTFLSSYVLFVALAGWAITARLSSASAGLATAVLIVTCPWIGYVSMTGLNEVALGFYILCALMVIQVMKRQEQEADSIASVLLVGLLAGAAAAVKYTGLVFAILPLGVWLALQYRKRFLLVGLVFSVGCAVTFGPWLIKNSLQTGNPVYPLLGSVFDSPQRTPAQVDQWDTAHKVPDSDSILGALGEFLWQGSRVSPLLIGAVLFLFVVQSGRRDLWGYYALVGYSLVVWWFATHHLQRFLVPVLPPLAVLGGIGLSAAVAAYPRWRKGIFAGLVIYAVMYLGAGMETDSRLLVRLETLRNGPVLPESDTATFRVHRYLNEQLGTQGRVVLVGDAEPFDLMMQVDYNTCFDRSVLADWLHGQDAQTQRQTLNERGVDYVYVSWEELHRYQTSYGYDKRINRDWIQELVQNGVLVEHDAVEIAQQSGQLFEVPRIHADK